MAVELLGAAIAGLLDWALEHNWEKQKRQGIAQPEPKWLYKDTPIGGVDDIIVMSTGMVAYLAGMLSKSDFFERLGAGMAAYGVGMILHHTLLRQITWK